MKVQDVEEGPGNEYGIVTVFFLAQGAGTDQEAGPLLLPGDKGGLQGVLGLPPALKTVNKDFQLGGDGPEIDGRGQDQPPGSQHLGIEQLHIILNYTATVLGAAVTSLARLKAKLVKANRFPLPAFFDAFQKSLSRVSLFPPRRDWRRRPKDSDSNRSPSWAQLRPAPL